MKLANYSTLINLADPYVAASGDVETALESAIAALSRDQVSRQFISDYPVPSDQEGQRKWVQAALTIRDPGELPPTLCNATDRLLQYELAQKLITDAASLPRLSGAFPAAAHVSIWDGDITTLKIDAITNAANAQLLGCFQPFHSCIDNAINCAAGPQLREDCHRLITLLGNQEATGEAKITRAYNLPSKFVLHTVGPIVGRDQKPTALQAKQLASCYSECLSLAAEVGLRSVALCGISTGVFGYPQTEATQVAMATVSDWFQKHPGALDHVVFNTFGEEVTSGYLSTADKWSFK